MSAVEIGLAFVEGIALIASPCILPVLPLVLSASVEGGRARPFGIIAGFVLAFSAFTLGSRWLVSALHLDLEWIKNGSLVLLTLFGLVLLSSKLSEKFSEWTQGAASLGNRLAGAGKEGFLSGMVIGMLIGLVWTPCAGPILAAVLVQVIRQSSDLDSLLTVAAFALGAGVPMLFIAIMGKKIMGKLSFFQTHAEAVRKTFGVLILLSVAVIASGVDLTSSFAKSSSESTPSTGLEDALSSPYAAPDFAGEGPWLNSPPLTMAGLKGKVVLIDFWTYSCINCIRTLPPLAEWDRRYRKNGLVIVGVHSPEFEFEKNVENVKQAITKFNIGYPVLMDNHLDTWTNFNNRYWPAHYLINRNGQVVYTHFGEGRYEETEHNIRVLLGLTGNADALPEQERGGYGDQTPETYLGYGRIAHFSSPESPSHDAPNLYHLPKFLPVDHWALDGRWMIQEEKIVAQAAGSALRLNFRAKKVFLVLGSADGKPIKLKLSLNGEPAGEITVKDHTLYTLIEQKNAANGQLDFVVERQGLEAYAFTFGG